jgi:hypothetical protein
MESRWADRIEQLLSLGEQPEEERCGLIRLMTLFATLPPPPDPFGLYPEYAEMKEGFLKAINDSDCEKLEEAFLNLYSHIHGYDVPYTPSERQRVEAMGGYLCHVGGLSPLLKAEPYIEEKTISGDFGAGNGLQGLLLQYLYPHKKTRQIEISSRMIESGMQLQEWLDIAKERVEWILSDIIDVSPAEMDFVYLYRPVRPSGPGKEFYQRFAALLERASPAVIVFSVADCLKPFLSSRFEVFYYDGHLTCFRRKR